VPTPEELAGPLVERIREVLEPGRLPLVVGLDGRSGSGKSTLAAATAESLGTSALPVTVVEGDQFYGGGSSATWDRRTVDEKVARGIDWARQRDVLLALRHEGAAEWRPFDWEAPNWDSDPAPLAAAFVRAVAGPVVLLEGAYSCRPELHDLLDLRVLLDVPVDVRRRQLLEREGEAYRADWEARWSGAEDHYFHTVMPPEAFDIVLGTGLASTRHVPDRQP
jgi:uridine kinase